MYLKTQRQSPLGGFMQSLQATPVGEGDCLGYGKGVRNFPFLCQTNSPGRKISLIKVTKLIVFEMMY